MRKRPRVLFLVHDGRGYGHVRRACRLADSVSDFSSCLVVTGNDAVAFLASPRFEYIKLPNIGRMNREIAAKLSMDVFIDLELSELARFRQALVKTITEEFRPDVVVVDHLPLGKFKEWTYPVLNHISQKVFVVRPVLGSPELCRSDILGDGGQEALVESYGSIVVAGEPNYSTILQELDVGSPLAQKVSYIGYVAPNFNQGVRNSVREDRGVRSDAKWIVCSSGSGHRGEALLETCIRLARQRTDCVFDIGVGSRSELRVEPESGRVQITRNMVDLAFRNAAADIVVCHGGYNTIAEALTGRANVIVHPTSTRNDEQQKHAQLLQGEFPIHLSSDIQGLPSLLDKLLLNPVPAVAQPLQAQGQARFAEHLKQII